MQHNLKRLTGEDKDVPIEKLTWFISEDEPIPMVVPEADDVIDISHENAMQLDILNSLFDDVIMTDDSPVDEPEDDQDPIIQDDEPEEDQQEESTDKFAVNTNLRSLVFGESGISLFSFNNYLYIIRPIRIW